MAALSESDSFDDSDAKSLQYDPNVKHPLTSAWTLWYDAPVPPNSRMAWGSNIKEVFSFGTVEDFWRMYNNVAIPSQLQQGCTYNLFKSGVEPKWEDPSNANGGRWTVVVPKKDGSKGLLDKLWLWLVLACIGQSIEEDLDQICGAVVNKRKSGDKISIWIKSGEDDDIVMRLGNAMKRALELPDSLRLEYAVHPNANARRAKPGDDIKFTIP